jgi:alpha-galactosidase
MDPYLLSLLTHPGILALHGDSLQSPARRIITREDLQVWRRELAGGRQAVAIFNMSDTWLLDSLNLEEAGIELPAMIRDVWREEELKCLNGLLPFRLPPHSVLLLTLE